MVSAQVLLKVLVKLLQFRRLGQEQAAGEMTGSLLAALAVLAGFSAAIQVTVPDSIRYAILFQPVVLKCNYDTSATQPPTVIWKYKSFCRDRVLDAFNPSSADNQINDQMQQIDPNYNPYVNCPDNSRTVRIVASKQGKAVTLDNYYQGRKITIINDADLSIEQTAWGDSGVYYCTVTAFQDLSGNNEGYVELIVLVYHAGKAATAGGPSLYAPSSYAASAYSHPSQAKMQPPLPVMVPMTQFNGGYGSDYDGASSVGNHSRVPLLQDPDAPSSVRSGYRIQANQQNDDMRVLYYVEKELAHFDPKSPGGPNSRYENTSAISEISSLHEDYGARTNLPGNISRVRKQLLPAIEDEEEGSLVSSVSRYTPRRTHGWDDSDRYYPGRHQRARSMESLDDIGWRDRDYSRGRQDLDRGYGRRESESEVSSRGHAQDRRGRDYSPERRGQYRKRSRSRDDLRELDRGPEPPRGGYDDSFLDEILRKKRGPGREVDSSSSSTARSRNRRDEELPLPPPSTETESVSSKGKNEKRLRKNDAVSRESLVV
ncbi:lipolysis-stimulated lipoprotein receptor isoform X3 [Carcharodon carcharias]|uniref:lipolysis-stimulated lipoprotein receptor isoform X3 n=1 Tax=Carcharodon carcharias TaxID=13397 RepID=UPI001B7DD342|nr:lipolysis-stimulated lipoprotein receptor isoform X3 [Carcharodon carcharias]